MAAFQMPDMQNRLILPENRLSQKALICPHLLNGAPLTHLYRRCSGRYKWRFYCCAACDCSPSVITLGEALKLFPEIEDFLKTTFTCSVLFYRAEAGGHWRKEILE